VLGLAGPAAAADTFGRDCQGSNFECTSLTVPLDRSGAVAGNVKLYVERVHNESQGAVFAFAGGPGQSATSLTENFARDFSSVLGKRDLIVFDQRGTGRSGLLNCAELERQRRNDTPVSERAEICANKLGAKRSFYTTRDSVEDIEAVRQHIDQDKITLYGVSYGTKVAEAYALKYPQHVERLVLDSVVEPEGQNIFDLDTFAAMPRVLSEVCRGECADVTDDLPGDLSALVDQMTAKQLRGPFVGRNGRRRTVGITRRQLYEQIRAGDLGDEIRGEYPSAIHSAVEGDPAPLLRIAHRFDGLGEKGPEPEPQPEILSFTLFTATLCEEAPLPWERTAAPADRPGQARERANAIPDSAFEPFDRETTLASDSDIISGCLLWPTNPEPPALGPGPLPDVPVLVLEGAEDLRTPVEAGARMAARFQNAKLVTVPKTAHAVLGRGDKCADVLLKRFFTDKALGDPCRNARRKVQVSPVMPARLADVAAARGVAGKRGRTLTAVGLTVNDLLKEYTEAGLLLSTPRGGGLRAGRYFKRGKNVRVKGFSLVPGVTITGSFGANRRKGKFTVAGSDATRGQLTLSRGKLRGRLGGRRVSLTLAKLKR
jgi:pimeloyl-ACP methyl ester carboxylesterase